MTEDLVEEILESVNLHRSFNKNTPHLIINANEVLSSHQVEGLVMEPEELPDGIRAKLRVKKGVKIGSPVHLCFGLLPERGVQHIIMDIEIEDEAEVSFMAHCTFPNAVEVEHLMEARIQVGRQARYSYFERHWHSEEGMVKVVPVARIELGERARFSTEFELLKGRVGLIDMDYRTICQAGSSAEMKARIFGRQDDLIKIREAALLQGEGSRAALTTHIAVKNQARAEINNEIIAEAPYARGHVDCKEIIQDSGIARAVPVVEVRNPKAHVTHEAAIGSVDSKQLQTLMSRGLSEEEAVDLIIEGLLS
ncbi:MAG TPA: SufD family Fe-S cluster assembly protein [Candidatus Saccharicenans sp.]|nr:SufD family Fe-S cluster assembly protein [Candidatus Saccharicenans sp.]HQO76595.1 SufD family Fe-S cluster assembly protein [Candidatus Saccharicenans sp.]HUM79780.1 SufD family Fe-S cluster assembly protein [Candidatus Saccharicenans sp.]